MKDMLFKGNSSKLELLIEKIQANKENQDVSEQDIKEALGTEGGSSWGSEGQTSPPSSCATPNSATDVPDSELTFTVGVTEGTPYACQFCDKAFPRLSYLKKHEQTHSDHMPFRCEFCSRLFKHKRSRDRHIKLHTGDKKYRCTQCEAAFSRSDHLKIHMKTHDNQKPFQCTVCNRGYNTAAALTSHMQNHKKSCDAPSPSPGTTFKCLQCSEVFRKPEELQAHMANQHHVESTGTSPNTRSPRNAQARIKLSPSYSTATPRLACMYCTKDNFSTMESLQIHVQAMHGSIVNGELHREMSLFNQHPIVSPNLMAQHMMRSSPTSHSMVNILPYNCELCTMRFGNVQAQQKHSMSVHGFRSSPGKETASLCCVQCNIQFTTPALFVDHYVLFHGSTMGLFSPSSTPTPTRLTEQLTPTDLSLAKKSPKQNIEERPPSAKRYRHSAENGLPSIVPNEPDTIPRIPTLNNQYDPGTLLCNQCGAAVPNFEAFRTHLKTHIEEAGCLTGLLGGSSALESRKSPVVSCPQCGANFSSNDDLIQHISSHFLTTTTEYGCQSCMKLFLKPDELQKHLMDIHAHHLYRCALCKEMFDSKVTIQVHFAVKHSNETKLYRCTACPAVAVFRTDVDFSVHVRAMHLPHHLVTVKPTPVHSPQLFRCLFCRMSFASELEMQLHLAVHTKQFHCHLCQESFHVEFLLDKHMQTHHSSQVLNGGDERDQMNTPGSKGSKATYKSNSSSNNSAANNSPAPGNSTRSTTLENGKKQETINNNNNATGTCDICERGDFSSEAELAAHRKLVHHIKATTSGGKLSLNCAYCNENCKSRTELENHMKTHSQGSVCTGKHKCNICDEMCPSAAVLAEHKLTHCKVINGSSCTHCKSTISNEDQFYQHLRQHSTSSTSSGNSSNSQLLLPTPCVICRQTLVSNVEANIHARFHLQQSETSQCCVCLQGYDKRDLTGGICKECYHRRGGKTSPTRCPECQLKFETGPALEAHLATVHRKTFQCIKCQLSFESERDIQMHVTSHLLTEGSNGHECRLCLRVLSSPLQLQTHLIEHTFAGCPTFTCYICTSVFTTAQGLQAHMLEHGLAARPYDCPRCSQRFFFRAELDNHSYVHLEDNTLEEKGKVPYYNYKSKGDSVDSSPLSSGSVLDIGSSENGNICRTKLKLHSERNNLGYKCSECNQDFGNASLLQTHIHNHHKPYNCSECDKEFTEANSLSVHLQTQHEIDSSVNNNYMTDIKQEVKEENNEDYDDDEEQIDVGNVQTHETVEKKINFENETTATEESDKQNALENNQGN